MPDNIYSSEPEWTNEILPKAQSFMEACKQKGIPYFIYAEHTREEDGSTSLVSCNDGGRKPTLMMITLSNLLRGVDSDASIPGALRSIADGIETELQSSSRTSEHKEETYEDCVKCPVLFMCSKGKDIVAAGPQPESKMVDHDPKSEDANFNGTVPPLPPSIQDLFRKMFGDDAEIDAGGEEDNDERF